MIFIYDKYNGKQKTTPVMDEVDIILMTL